SGASLRGYFLPTDQDLQVGDDHIADAYLAIDRLYLSQTLAQLRQPAFDHRVVNHRHRPLRPKRLQVRQPDSRHPADRAVEAGRPSPFEPLDSGLRPGDRVDLPIAQGLIDHRRDQRVHDLFANGRGPQPGFHERPGRFAWAKALDAHALGEAVENPLIGSVDLIGGHLDGQAHLAALQCLGDYRYIGCGPRPRILSTPFPPSPPTPGPVL